MADVFVKQQWEQEQRLLGLARTTSDGEFAPGGLATLAQEPTVRLTILPAEPPSLNVPAEKPETAAPARHGFGQRVTQW